MGIEFGKLLSVLTLFISIFLFCDTSTASISNWYGLYETEAEAHAAFLAKLKYINENQVSMTVPVEADIKNARMKFYVGTVDREKNLRDGNQVNVIAEKERTVVSCGIRGSYSRANFQKGKGRLESWLRNDLSYLVDDYLNEEVVGKSGLLDVGEVSSLVKRFRKKQGVSVTRIWLLLMFVMWYETSGL